MKRLLVALAGYLVYRWWSGSNDTAEPRSAQPGRGADRPPRQA